MNCVLHVPPCDAFNVFGGHYLFELDRTCLEFVDFRILKTLYIISPASKKRRPDKMTVVLNCRTSSKQDSRPKNPVMGNFPTLSGTLNGLFSSALRYLMYINEPFTNAKVMNAPKLVKLATSSKSPRKTNVIDANIVIRIARKGVPVLVLSFDSTRGKAPSFAIP